MFLCESFPSCDGVYFIFKALIALFVLSKNKKFKKYVFYKTLNIKTQKMQVMTWMYYSMCYSFKKLVLIVLYLSLSLIVKTSLQWEKSAVREQYQRVFCSQCGTKKTSYSIQNVTRIDAAFFLLHSHQNDSHLYLYLLTFIVPFAINWRNKNGLLSVS